MTAIRISGMITEARELVVKLPDDMPAGPVEIIIQPQAEPAVEDARAVARAALAAAGLLGDAHSAAAAGLIRPSDDALREAGRLRPGKPSMHESIDAERGEDPLDDRN